MAKNTFVSGVPFKGIEKRAKLKKIDIRLVLRILWHKRITPSLKEWRLWHFSIIISPYKCKQDHSSEGYLFLLKKNLWLWMLKANKEQVSLKSYSLKIRIDSINQIFRNKEKVKKTHNINILTRITDQKRFHVYIHVY